MEHTFAQRLRAACSTSRVRSIAWFVGGLVCATALNTAASSYPMSYGQCLRWAADRPTSEGARTARVICVGILRNERRGQQ